MASLIVDAPAETKLAIVAALQAVGTSKDLRNLSCTCHPFRDILIPEIFRSLVLRNDDKSAASVKAIIDEGYAQHVKELHYRAKHDIPDCEYEGEASDDELDEATMERFLPTSVANILSNLSSFPKLEKLIVEFPFGNGQSIENDGVEGDDDWNNAFYNFQDEESPSEAQECEQRYAWRAMMATSWEAIVQNKNLAIKALELRGTVSKEVSTWRSQAFLDLLEPLKEFELSIRGNDNGAGWHINTLDGYHAFLKQLATYFSNHLPNATSLTLKASDYGTIGLEGLRHSPFPCNPKSVPNLQSLHLEDTFIDPPLVDFLVQHSPTLKAVTFNNCMGGISGLAENGIHWHNLFASLINAHPRKLTRFEVLPVKVEGVGAGEPGAKQYGDVEKRGLVEKMMGEDGGRRGFSYKSLDDKYGMLFDDEDVNLDAFLDGEDQRAFDGLMEVVRGNGGEI